MWLKNISLIAVLRFNNFRNILQMINNFMKIWISHLNDLITIERNSDGYARISWFANLHNWNLMWNSIFKFIFHLFLSYMFIKCIRMSISKTMHNNCTKLQKICYHNEISFINIINFFSDAITLHNKYVTLDS